MRSLIIGIFEEKNRAEVNILIAIILVYSAIKISANGPLLYSVLNPETSSDSPSARSKGVRLVSASIVINQMKNIGIIIKQALEWERKEGCRKLYELVIRREDKRIRDILTSYEIVCAIPRRAPIREYLELEDQPAKRVV